MNVINISDKNSRIVLVSEEMGVQNKQFTFNISVSAKVTALGSSREEAEKSVAKALIDTIPMSFQYAVDMSQDDEPGVQEYELNDIVIDGFKHYEFDEDDDEDECLQDFTK